MFVNVGLLNIKTQLRAPSGSHVNPVIQSKHLLDMEQLRRHYKSMLCLSPQAFSHTGK